MLRISLARLATAVSLSGGIGFLAGGYDLSYLSQNLSEAASIAKSADLQLHDGMLPIGVGFLVWGASLEQALKALQAHPVAAVWLFAPRRTSDLREWARSIRRTSNHKTKIWVQVGTVVEAIEVAKTTKPDVLVMQGSDSGGHGLQHRASLITLLPEVRDRLEDEGITGIAIIASGGIMDGRSAAAAVALGADGVCLGTRLLASQEAVIARGYQNEVLRVADGGVSTVSTTIYDTVRGIRDWPQAYTGRGVANQTFLDAVNGMSEEKNVELYQNALKSGDQGWGPDGRLCTYAGTGVGLIRNIMPARDIVREVQREAVEVSQKAALRCKL
jgi:nitronate monooxygenase